MNMEAAENAIRRLIAGYCDAVSRRDPEGVRALFTADARVQIADMPVRVGHKQIVDGLSGTISRFSFLHQKCDTGLIDVEADQARARFGILEVNRLVGSDKLNMITGCYEDEYARTAEGWRFHRRRFTMIFRVVLPTAEMQEFPLFVPEFAFAP